MNRLVSILWTAYTDLPSYSNVHPSLVGRSIALYRLRFYHPLTQPLTRHVVFVATRDAGKAVKVISRRHRRRRWGAYRENRLNVALRRRERERSFKLKSKVGGSSTYLNWIGCVWFEFPPGNHVPHADFRGRGYRSYFRRIRFQRRGLCASSSTCVVAREKGWKRGGRKIVRSPLSSRKFLDPVFVWLQKVDEAGEKDESGEKLLTNETGGNHSSDNNVEGKKLNGESRLGEMFGSQYLYYDDDENGAAGIDVFNPGTPMMSRANDGWLVSAIRSFQTIARICPNNIPRGFPFLFFSFSLLVNQVFETVDRRVEHLARVE